MKTRNHLIVMAKAPVAGRVKTRLVPALGEAGAAALAGRLLEHAVSQAVAAHLGAVELCLAPDLTHPLGLQMQARHGLVLSAQVEGDIGVRMQRALDRALQRAECVCLVGTDAPAIDAAYWRLAFDVLATHDAVFGPAWDGGYALVGLRRPLPQIFVDVPWSTPQVMAVTRRRLVDAGVAFAELPHVHDIDEPADLAHLPAGWL
jgi:uncharacterized protein